MIRLTLALCGTIWAFMAYSPDLESPVFVEIYEGATPEITPTVEPEVVPVALVSPVEVAAPVVEIITPPTSEPVIPTPVVVEATPEPAEPERIIWFVTASRVNVREGPSTDFTILGKVIYGEAAEIISDPDAEWVKIRIEGDGIEGYIAKRFMAAQDPLG